MKINYAKMEELIAALQEIQDMKMPFKTSIVFAKNLANLKKEEDFWLEQERKFAQDYLEYNEDGMLVTTGPNTFKVKAGKEAECAEARKAIDTFEVDVELRKVPITDVENLELTPAQVGALMDLIEEE